MNIHQNYTLITGGSSGIGYELAKLFAKDGNNLILVSRDQAMLDQAATDIRQQYPVEIITISKDLFEPTNAFDLYSEIKGKGLLVDTLVNDAGQGLYGEFVDTAIERELAIINLNISSLVVLTKLFLQDMWKEARGKS